MSERARGWRQGGGRGEKKGGSREAWGEKKGGKEARAQGRGGGGESEERAEGGARKRREGGGRGGRRRGRRRGEDEAGWEGRERKGEVVKGRGRIGQWVVGVVGRS